jgi:transcription elongation factor Elf1
VARVQEVTCPRCQTRQSVADADGYTCTSCGEVWAFASCANCGVRFHMRPGTTAWTCPECGHENGSAAMVDLAATPREPERAPERRTPVQPRHAAPPPAPKGRSGPPTRARLATIAVIGIAAVLVVAFGLSALGSDGGAEGAVATTGPPSPTTPAPSSSLTPTETLCLHLRDLQLVRVDNYTRLAAELANDEAAIDAAGDAKLAAEVDTMRTAVLAYRDALASQGDTTQVSGQIAQALGALPCGQTGG